MRYPGYEGWTTIEDFADSTPLERLHCSAPLRKWLDTAITRGRQRVLLAKEKHAAVGKSVCRRKVQTTGMTIRARA